LALSWRKKKTEKMKLSVNILCWNNYNILHDTLHNLAEELKNIEHEIIIVDNGSTDGCQDLATIKNGKNLGISIAKNQGIEASRGEFILLLDGDILYMPGSITCMFDWLEKYPKEYAIGFYPNRFANERGLEEEMCIRLYEPKIHTAACLFYGMFRRTMFDRDIKCSVDGPFALPGYGWEDRDFFMQMQAKGIKQWVAHINSATGKYYHAINSSIKQMGHDVYISSSRERAKFFKDKWISSLTPT